MPEFVLSEPFQLQLSPNLCFPQSKEAILGYPRSQKTRVTMRRVRGYTPDVTPHRWWRVVENVLILSILNYSSIRHLNFSVLEISKYLIPPFSPNNLICINLHSVYSQTSRTILHIIQAFLCIKSGNL